MAQAEYDQGEFARCSTTLGGVQRRFTDIIELASDTDPDWYVWGLVGVLPAKWYWAYAEDTHEHLGLIAACLRDHVERLDCAAETYQSIEDRMAAAMEQLKTLLE